MASLALLMSSRRKISLWEYREWVIRLRICCSSLLNACFSAAVSVMGVTLHSRGTILPKLTGSGRPLGCRKHDRTHAPPSRPAMTQALEGVIGAYEGVLPARNPGPPAIPPLGPGPRPGARVAEAVAFAIQKHGDQVRKGTSTAYLTHLLAVASLVGESGGSEDEVIAGMLHDAVEDGGGAPVLAEIQAPFGPAVAAIVKCCTDADAVGEKAPWLERKRAYMAHLVEAPISALRVVCADKLHNVQAIAGTCAPRAPPCSSGSGATGKGPSGPTGASPGCSGP